MPNWTTNELTIAGPRIEIARLVHIIMPKGDLSDVAIFSRLLPMPPEYQGTISGSNPLVAGDGMDWYTWQRDNWGVKWGDCRTEIFYIDVKTEELAEAFNQQFGLMSKERDYSLDSITLHYETPWCSPQIGLETLSIKWPMLSFSNEAQYEGEEDEALEYLDYGPLKPYKAEEDSVDYDKEEDPDASALEVLNA